MALTGGQRSAESAGPRLLEVFLRAEAEDGGGAAAKNTPTLPARPPTTAVIFSSLHPSISLCGESHRAADNFLSCSVSLRLIGASVSLSRVATSLMWVQELCIYGVWQHAATAGDASYPAPKAPPSTAAACLSQLLNLLTRKKKSCCSPTL